MRNFLLWNRRQVVRGLLCLLASVLSLNTALMAQEMPAAAPAANLPAEQDLNNPASGYIVNFNNVGITEYLRFISRISGVNFVFNPEELNFRVTIVSEEPASVENIMSILLQVLQVHGLQLQEQGRQILIYREANLGKLATVIPPGSQEPLPPLVTRIFRIDNGTAEQAELVVKPLLSPQAVVSPAPATGHLIVTDIAGNIDKIDSLLRTLDEMEIAYYEVKYSYADAMVTLAQRILEPVGGKEITLVAQPSTDTIFIVASPYQVRRALGVLRMLDVPPNEGALRPYSEAATTVVPAVPTPTTTTTSGPVVSSGPQQPLSYLTKPVEKNPVETTTFGIYKLQFHQGDEIRTALQDIADSLQAAEGKMSELAKTISTVQWIKTTNSLVISGPQAAINRVRALVEELDVPLREVYIELLVIRTTQANTFNIGVEWGGQVAFEGNGTNPTVVTGGIASTQGANSGLSTGINPLLPPAPILTPEGLTLGAIGRFVSFNGQLFTSLGLLVNALQTCEKTTILLNPKILTLDNNEARLFVGSNIAFQASTITQPGSSTVVGEVVYRDIGTTLAVKPLLSNSDMVTIQVSNEISANQAASSSTQTTATLNPTLKSTTETKVTVPDGYFVVIAGQINDTRQKIHRGLPCLGGLPIIGTCFSTKALDDTRDNVVIFIRPHIISTKAQMVHLTEGEKLRVDSANRPGQYQMDLETILDVLNIKPEDSKPCCNPAQCDCGFPCWSNEPNLCRPPCHHDPDEVMDRYFDYPCECP